MGEEPKDYKQFIELLLADGADVNEVAAGLIKRIKADSHILQGIVDKPAWEEWKALNVALDAVATRVAQEYDLPA